MTKPAEVIDAGKIANDMRDRGLDAPIRTWRSIPSQVLAHKQKLRDLIDRHGGVTQVARLCGIPQPSLSRMLNSASMPRRSTLYRIANALKVPESDVVGEWIR
ncbi:MAG: helix-turn-helix transcriptional regulator [Deltaproteobacteria bacterium]|nr:helix-turn-helix transcriptional regulator [Deltaproteobacteria bacterium]